VPKYRVRLYQAAFRNIDVVVEAAADGYEYVTAADAALALAGEHGENLTGWVDDEEPSDIQSGRVVLVADDTPLTAPDVRSVETPQAIDHATAFVQRPPGSYMIEIYAYTTIGTNIPNGPCFIETVTDDTTSEDNTSGEVTDTDRRDQGDP